MRRDDEFALFALFGLWLVSKLESPVRAAEKALQEGGAKVYEFVHPSQRDHADDLPGHQWTKQAIMQLAAHAGFPDPRMAAAIALAESGGVPNALGDGGTSVGLWQIHLPSWPQYTHDDMRDPVKNAAAAFRISRNGTDWRHWSTFKTGRYRSFL